MAAAQPTAADSAAARGAPPVAANAAPVNGGGTAPVGSTMPAAATASAPMAAAPMASAPSVAMAAGTLGTRITSIANLPSPEAVVVDTAAGLLLVAGSEPLATGSRGVIMRVEMDGTVRDARWIVGGSKSAILRTPRGMAIVGDTLWVVDGTVLRGFARRTGTPIVTIPMGSMGAVALTDVAVGGDGELYVADAATTYSARGVAQRKGSGRIFRVSERKPSVALEHVRLVQPTALSWDPIMSRLLIAAAGTDTIMAWRPGQSSPETVAVAAGPWDGIVAVGGMVFYAVNGARGEVQFFQNGMSRRVVDGARGAGDVALDATGRLIVPLPSEQRVEIWQVRR